jgi:rhamnosyltransferase
MTDPSLSGRKRDVALGIVTYRPAGSLLARLQQALDAGFAVYVFDNSPDEPACRDSLEGRPRAHYATDGRNAGLGVGISAVCSQAFDDGFPALLFFDQDTVFEARTLEFIDAFHRAHHMLGRDHSAVLFNARSGTAASDVNAPMLRDIRMAISSGTMFFLDKLRAMNWHNRMYFVDCVDYEFCFRSECHGYRIAEFSATPGFDHLSEQPDRVFCFMGRQHAVRCYAASRIKDTVQASTRLALTALRAGRFSFFATMVRSLGIYLGFQIIARLIPRSPPRSSPSP